MHRSTEAAESQRRFAAEVLENLLRHIETENINKSRYPQLGQSLYRVSHAWTDGPLLYVVYTSPPGDIVWGLVRDTRESLIDPGPWNETDKPSLYYYLLDFEEGWSGPLSRSPGGEADAIHWRGHQHEGLPERLSDVPKRYHYAPQPISDEELRQEPPPVSEPRRYADPNGPLPPGAGGLSQ